MISIPSHIIHILIASVRRYPISFIFIAFALFLPDFLAESDLNWIIKNPFLFCFRMLLYGGISYIFVTIAFFLSKLNTSVGSLIIFIIHTCILTLAIADIFMFRAFGSHLNAYILQLINESTQEESSEFLQTYLHTSTFAKVCIVIILFVGVEFFSYKLFRFFKNYHSCNFSKPTTSRVKDAISSIVSLYILLSLGVLVYVQPGFSFNWAANLESVRIWNFDLIHSFVFNVHQAGVQFYDERSSFERCEKANKIISATHNNSSCPQNIVIIIGESYNRHHSSLYGYDHKTNPRLSQLKHLYVFDDVISPINGTSPFFKIFLSMASVDDTYDWCDVPLFPAIFKYVGFNVAFFSNQFVKQLNMTPWDASAGFVNNPKIEPRIFSHRNSQKHQYDEGLIEEFLEQRDAVESDSLNLLFFHLMGQHVDTKQRYPKGREAFFLSDYQRPELTETQVQEVANYDNATYYNDSIVCEIIKLFNDKDALIMYFSDHGDEANDYRPHIGRDFNLNAAGAPGLHCQLDVPFLIYLTDSCCVHHPELEQRIALSIHHPFMLDDLSHLLLDISCIQTSWFQPTRSLINKKYNMQRRRIIDGYSTTTPIDYDSVCNAYGDWKIGFTNKKR